MSVHPAPPGPSGHGQQVYEYHQDAAPEVVRHDFPEVVEDHGMEVVPPYSAPEKDVSQVEKELAPTPDTTSSRLATLERITNRRSKRCMIISVLIFLVILVAIVVGAVVGSRATSGEDAAQDAASTPIADSPSETSTAPSTSSTEATSAVSSMPPLPMNTGSVLAAASWHNMDGEEDHSFVAYQMPNGSFQISRYVKTFISDDGFWARPHVIEPDNEAQNRSGLAIGQIYMNQSSYLDMTFIGSSETLDGTLFDTSANWTSLELRQERELRKEVPADSKVAAMGILMVFRELDGSLTLRRRYGDDARWNTETVSNDTADSLSSTNLALVHLSANYTEVYNERALAVLYQAESGKLIAQVHGQANLRADSWPEEFPEPELPLGGSFAAFSVRRSPGFRNDFVSTYVLYEDTSGTIRMLYTVDGQSWEETTPEGLSNADRGTSIACTSPDTLDEESYWTLGHAFAMTRCYFFEDDSLIKVQLNGTDWINKERVRIE